MVSKEQIEQILNKVIKQDVTEADKCGGGSSSGSSGGGKKKPKKKPSNKKTPKQLLEEFDRKNFAEEEYEDGIDAHPTGVIGWGWESPQGRLQKIQSDLQENVNYTGLDKDVAHAWSTELFLGLNCYLYDKPDIDGIRYSGSDIGLDHYETSNGEEYTIKQSGEMLSKAIDKSPRLQEACVTYKLCPTDELDKMEIGDTSSFKGFQSTTFNHTVCTKAIQDQVGGWIKGGDGYGGSNRAVVRFYHQKGGKGMVIDDTVGCHDWQSELLIDKGQKYMLVGRGNVDIGGIETYAYDVLLYD